MEEKYECNAATIFGNADTIVKEKKVLNCRRMGRWNQLIGQISLACTWNIVYAYVRKVSYFFESHIASTLNIVYAYIRKVSCIFDSGSIHAMALFLSPIYHTGKKSAVTEKCSNVTKSHSLTSRK